MWIVGCARRPGKSCRQGYWSKMWTGCGKGLDRLGLGLEDLEDTFMRFADFPDVEEWPVPDAGEGRAGPDRCAQESFSDTWRTCGDSGPTCPPSLEPTPSSPISSACRGSSPITETSARQVRLVEVLTLFDKNGKVTQKEWKQEGRFSRDDARQEGARWEQFREEVVRPALCAWREYCYPTVLAVLFRARGIYDGLRAERGLLNFQDLLMRAAELLRDKPHVRRYFRERFAFLLVDEFQDTDPVQAEVMMLLTATDPKETEWRRCEPRPGSLFVVGDPKQSIYRFRRADIVTYNEVKGMIRRGEGPGKEGVVVRLSTNFRTIGSVIDWVNQVFAPEDAPGDDSSGEPLRFPGEDTDESPGYVPLETGRVAGSDGSARRGVCACRSRRDAARPKRQSSTKPTSSPAPFGMQSTRNHVARTERELAKAIPKDPRRFHDRDLQAKAPEPLRTQAPGIRHSTQGERRDRAERGERTEAAAPLPQGPRLAGRPGGARGRAPQRALRRERSSALRLQEGGRGVLFQGSGPGRTGKE